MELTDAMIARLREMIDRQDIIDCLHRYTRGMDRQDREMVRSAYHDDAVDVHGRFFTLDAFLDWVFEYHSHQLFHQHYISNHTIDIDGDTAHAETYFQFVATYPEPDTPVMMAGGRYVDRLERRAGRWAIAARLCVSEWLTEVPWTPRGAHPIDVRQLLDPTIVSRDRDDVSYVRPLVLRPGWNADRGADAVQAPDPA